MSGDIYNAVTNAKIASAVSGSDGLLQFSNLDPLTKYRIQSGKTADLQVFDERDRCFGEGFVTVSPLDYGAKGDGKFVGNGVCNGTTTLTSATAAWTSSDVGKALLVLGGSGAGTAQVETLTIATACTGSGNATVTVQALGLATQIFTFSVALLNGDTVAQVATKVKDKLLADTTVYGSTTQGAVMTAFSEITAPGGGTVVFTKTDIAKNDTALNVTIDNDTCAGLTPVAVSTNTTAGVAPIHLKTTITSVTNSTTVIMANAASVSTSGHVVVWGTDDTAAIQSALNFVSVCSYPAKVVFPSLLFIITDLLTVTGDTTVPNAPNINVTGYKTGVHISGSGSSTILQITSGQGVIKLTYCQWWELSNFILASASATGNVLQVTLSHRGEASDLWIRGCQYGVYADGGVDNVYRRIGGPGNIWQGSIAAQMPTQDYGFCMYRNGSTDNSYVLIDAPMIEGCNFNGIYAEYAYGLTILSGTSEGHGTGAPNRYGLYLYRCIQSTVIGLDVEACGDGVTPTVLLDGDYQTTAAPPVVHTSRSKFDTLHCAYLKLIDSNDNGFYSCESAYVYVDASSDYNRFFGYVWNIGGGSTTGKFTDLSTTSIWDGGCHARGLAPAVASTYWNYEGLTNLKGGLNVGTATGAGTGDIKASGSVSAASGLNVGSSTGATAGQVKSSAGHFGTDATFTGGVNVGSATGAATGQIKSSGDIIGAGKIQSVLSGTCFEFDPATGDMIIGGGNSQAGDVYVKNSSGVTKITLSGTNGDITALNGINVGSASGAAAGQIKTSDDIIAGSVFTVDVGAGDVSIGGGSQDGDLLMNDLNGVTKLHLYGSDGTITTNSGVKWDLGGYTIGAPTVEGYLSVVVAGATYRIAVEAV